MKIAQIMGSNKEGGAELYYERLTSALAEAGETVFPIIRYNSLRGQRLRALGLEPKELNFGGAFDFSTRWKLKKLLKEFNPELVFAWMNRAASHTPRGDWTLIRRLGGYYNLKYYQHCDHLVANTQKIMDWIIQQGWPEQRTHYLPNFVTDLRTKAKSLCKGKPRILSVGRLHPNKGFDTLIKAMRFVPEAELLIAGEGAQRKPLEALIRSEGLTGRVRLLGWNNDIKELLADADIFVCPSRHEPLGNVIIEAFSAECAVVATHTDGASSLITHGFNGLLSPVDDAEALAQQINRVLEDSNLRDKMVKEARADFEAKYSVQPVIQRWKQFMQNVEKN